MDPESHAQDVISCDLCQSPDVQLLCESCRAYLCKACVGEHSFSDEFKDHKIVKICSTPAHLPSPSCKSHKNERCEMFCNVCQKPVCLRCIASQEHIGHKLSILSEVLESRRQVIQEDRERLMQVLRPTYRCIASDIEIQMTHIEKHYDEVLTRIIQHTEEWRQETEQYIENIKAGLLETKNKQMDILKKFWEETDQTKSDIDRILKTSEELLRSKEVTGCLDYISKIEEYEKVPAKINFACLNFNPKQIQENDFRDVFGICTDICISSEDSGYPLKTYQECAVVKRLEEQARNVFESQVLLQRPRIVSTLYAGLRCRGIACNNRAEIWVRCDYQTIIQFNRQDGKRLKEINAYTSNIAVTNEGDLVYTDFSSLTIVKKDDTKEIVELHSFKGRAERVCCTVSGDFLVLCQFGNEPLKVVRYTRSGSEIQTIQYDSEGEPLFTEERFTCYKHIAENKNMDVCVSISNSLKQPGSLVVVDKAGLLRFKYGGQMSRENPFHPTGLAVNRQCCIFVADSGNKFIDVISRDGILLYSIKCDDSIKDICLDNHDGLYISLDGYTCYREILKVEYLRKSTI